MHVHANAVANLDGKLPSQCREQVMIGGDDDFARVDEIHATADAVVAGIGTVFADDPYLMLDDPGLVVAREGHGDSLHPVHVVADSRARTPIDARILGDATMTYLLVSGAMPGGRREALEAAEAEFVVADAERVLLPDASDALEARGADQLTVEGDGELISSLFGAGLADEFTFYVGSLVIDGRNAPTLADGDGFASDFPRPSLRDVERAGDGVLLTYDY